MVSITEETADELDEIAEENDVSAEDVRSTFKEKYEDVEENGALPEDRVENLALRMTRTEVLNDNRVPTEAVEMAVVGGDIRNWSNGDTFVGKALVDLEPNNEKPTEYLSSIIIDEDDVNLSEVYDAFSEVGNIVQGEFSVSEADIAGFRVLNSSEDTELTVTRPDDRGPVLEEIRNVVPEVTIRDMADNLSATNRNEDGNVFPSSFGVDIRRIVADIYDGYKDSSEGNGTYTVRDETTFDEDDLVETAVYTPDEDNENATPGLTCWTDPNRMEFGSGSVVEFFGVVSQNEDGEVVFNTDGLMPIVEDGDGFDGYDATSNNSNEREQSDSSVDRTRL